MHIHLMTLILLSTLFLPTEAFSQMPQVQLQSILDERLPGPLFVTNSHDGTGRLFILEQRGRVLAVQPEARTSTLVLDLTDKVLTGATERGLLGLTFHPRFAENRQFFVDYTRKPDGAIVVARYQVSATNPNVADPAETVILTIPHPGTEHNGGMIEFGPDGFLYISTGDGGGSYDPPNNSQDLNSLLGKILRIDVDTPANAAAPYSSPSTNPFYGAAAGRDEIFALGLRNPWRFSFDRVTQEIYAGDVGQDAFEEINVIEAGGNYGWRVYEGTLCTNRGPAACEPANYLEPILQYGHGGRGGACSVTGGYVYRGNKQSLPFGAYIYGDFCTGEIFMLYRGRQMRLMDTTKQITSFGEDEEGEIYAVGSGSIDRIVNTGIPFTQTTSFEITPGGSVSFETHGLADQVSVTHAQIHPNGDDSRPSALAFIGYRKNGVLVSEAAVPATSLISSGRLYVEIGNGRNTGIAVVNPDMIRPAVVTFYFTDTEGNNFGNSVFAVVPGGKIAAFLNEFPFFGPASLSGTMTFDSSVPLSIVALEGITNQRSEFLTTTLPVVDLNAAGTGSTVMPHFAAGGGWTTEVILVNPTEGFINGTLKLTPALELPQPITLDGTGGSETSYAIAPGSSRKIRIGSRGAEIAGAFHVRQIVIFGGTEEEPTSGNIYFFDHNGQPIEPPVG